MSLADFFRPRYKHSDPTIRAEAVEDLDKASVDILKQVAVSDPAGAVRRIAIDRIDDPTLLEAVASAQDDPKLTRRAQSRAAKLWITNATNAANREDFNDAVAGLNELGDTEALGQVVAKVSHREWWRGVLKTIDDDRVLADLVRSVSSRDKRLACLAQVESVGTLRSIALEAKKKETGIAALERLTDASDLEFVVSKARNKAVKNAAKRRLAALQESTNKPAVKTEAAATEIDKSKTIPAEQAQLLRQMEKLARGNEWVESLATVNELMDEWGELPGDYLDEDLSERFQRASEIYFERRDKYAKGVDEMLARKRAAEKAATKETAGEAGEQPSDTDESAASAPKKPTREQIQAQERQRNEQRVKLFMTELAELGETKSIRKLDEVLRKAKDAATAAGNLPESARALGETFEEKRQALVVRIRELRDAEEWQRWANVKRQEALIEKAKALLTADEPRLGSALKKLQREFKTSGPVPRSKNQELWDAFKSTCDEVYERVKEQRAEEAEARQANLRRKEELCEKAEALQDSTNWDETAKKLKDLQAEWKTIGSVGRKHSQAVWDRFRAACDAFFESRKPHLDARLHEQTENLKRKQALCEKAEALAESEEWQETGNALKDMQKEWRDVGLVPREDAKEINQRFRSACDLFFKRRDEFRTRAAEEKKQEREKWAQDVAALPTISADEAKDAALELRKTLLEADLPDKLRLQAHNDLHTALSQLVQATPDLFANTELDADKSRSRRKKLVERAQQLADERAPVASEETSGDIAQTLMAAMHENALGTGNQTRDGRSYEDAVADLREAWLRLGPVPNDQSQAQAFDAACLRALGDTTDDSDHE